MPQNVKVGSRVRNAATGALGTITWANAKAMKIKGDDDQVVTWHRDAIGQSLELVDETPVPANAEMPEPAATEDALKNDRVSFLDPSKPPEFTLELTGQEGTETPPASSANVPDANPADPTGIAECKPPVEAKKMSALDAAAKVLAETGRPMGCKAMIEAMAGRGYWTSPGGKTPEATLSAAIGTEIKKKGDASRFVKAARGKFALKGGSHDDQ